MSAAPVLVVGLGTWPADLLPLATTRALEAAEHVVLEVPRRPLAAALPSVRWITLRDLDGAEPATALARLAAGGGSLVYADSAVPAVSDAGVRALIRRAPAVGLTVHLLAGPALPSGASLQIIAAGVAAEPDPLLPALLSDWNGEAIGRLSRLYPADHEVILIGGSMATQTARALALGEAAHAAEPGESLYLPPVAAELAGGSPHGLRAIVHRLRAPGGCPWDREQTPASLVRYVLEEAHEVADAIEGGEPPRIAEELGDLLLQVYLQAEIAEEYGQFDLTDVMAGLARKLIYRHPHVFAETEVADAREVERNWDRLKQAEKGATELDPLALNVPRSLPALLQAQEVQRKLSKLGFDWPDRRGPLEKLDEELAELKAALGDRAASERELGDVLFMIARLARDADLDAEAALRGTIRRVRERWAHVASALAAQGRSPADLEIAELVRLWQEAKQQTGRGARI